VKAGELAHVLAFGALPLRFAFCARFSVLFSGMVERLIF
jgi:hypothetical protein